MAKPREFRPETKFVVDHWDDIQLLQEAREEAERDLEGLLRLVGSAVEEWDRDAWKSGTESRGVYAWRTEWGNGEEDDDCFFVGVADFDLKALLSEKPSAWSYVSLPKHARDDEYMQRMLQAAQRLERKDAKFTIGGRYVWRYIPFKGTETSHERVFERLISEVDDLAKLRDEIDAVGKAPRR
jgi:hypothetical protein